MYEAQLEQIIEELQMFVEIDTTNKSNREIVLEYFSDIIKYCDKYLVSDLIIKEVVYDPEFDKSISNNFNEILKLLPDSLNNSFLSKVTQFNPSAIIENIDYIISEDNIEHFWNNFEAIKGKYEKVDNLINEKLDNSDNIFAKALVYNFLQRKGNNKVNSAKFINEDIKEQYAKTLGYVIREMLDETESSYTDIKFLNRGIFSEVYQIGNKVLKVGNRLNRYIIPNHRRLLQPIARANYTLPNGQILSCFQVFPMVDTYFSKEEKTDQKLYEIYKELREDGIIWIDAKWENLGKLLEDNVTKWKGKKIEVDSKSVGLDKKYKGETLKRGDIVIIDLDMIYREGDPNVPWNKMSDKSRKLEERYLKEKNITRNREEDR